jgi:hypothetical protein
MAVERLCTRVGYHWRTNLASESTELGATQTFYVKMLHDPTNSSWYLTKMLLTTVDNFRCTKLYINKIWYNRNLSKLSCSYPCTDITSFRKNPTNALINFNTNLFTLLHSYMFQPSRGHPQGVLMFFVSWVNKMRVQRWLLEGWKK